MRFCEGEDAVYEDMMKGVPGFDRHILKEDEKDCKHCLHYNVHAQKCGLAKCPYFD